MYASKNPYRPIRTEVSEVITETPTIKTLRLHPDEPLRFETGQFVELTIPGIGEAPFTPSSKPYKADGLEVSVMKVGKVTDRIHKLSAGNIVGLRGPFGTGYPMQEFKGKEIVVVGGGCGFAPLRSLMYEFFHRSGEYKKLLFRGGCKTPKDFLYRKEIEGWSQRKDLDLALTVDKGDAGWTGNVGVVTTILDDLGLNFGEAIAIVCGPPVMMKFATLKLLDLGIQQNHLFLSMEKNMSCGFGMCGHCRLGSFYTCKDGPVFRFNKISHLPNIWE